MKLLLEQRADVNQRRPSDLYSGLMIGSQLNRPKTVKLLMKHGADVNLESLSQQSALEIASISNSVEAAQVLLESKEIDVNAHVENCAIFLSVKHGNAGMTLLLKKQEGAKATSPVCLEKAQELATLQGKHHITRMLQRN